MTLVEIIVIYIAVGICSSQDLAEPNLLGNQNEGVAENKHWNIHSNSLVPEKALNTSKDGKNYEKLVKGKLQNEKFNSQGEGLKNNLDNKMTTRTCNYDMVYLIKPPKNSSSEIFDMNFKADCQDQKSKVNPCCKDSLNTSSQYNQTIDIKESRLINLSKKDEARQARRVLTRDTDSFYDNELIRKVTSNNGELPNKFHIESLNKDPFLIYKESNKDSERKIIQKREVTKPPDYDYNYYDDKPDDDSSAVKGGFQNMKEKLSKIIKSKGKDKNSRTTKQNNNKEESSTKTNELKIGSSFAESTDSTSDNITVSKENNSTKSHTDVNGSEEANKLSEPNEVVGLEENSNIKSVPRKKDPCRIGNNEPSKCLPHGGIPKNPGVPPIGRNRDAEYEKLLKGEIPEKVVKAILDKVKKNPTMASDLGICDADFKEVKDLFNTIRNKQNECCIKLKGEFKCFLNWLLTIDPSRKKRSARNGQIGLDKMTSSKLYGNENSCPSFLHRIHKPSPQYQKLFEKVERYKEERGDPWSLSPDAFQIPEHSINF